MSDWKVAPAILGLQRTLDIARPGRRLRNPDGTVGDLAHMRRGWPVTDHAPDPSGLVCAVDVHDSDALDDGSLYEALKAAGTRNPIKYAINAGRIWSPERGERAYTGISPHHDHCHVSVTQEGKWLTGDPEAPEAVARDKALARIKGVQDKPKAPPRAKAKPRRAKPTPQLTLF